MEAVSTATHADRLLNARLVAIKVGSALLVQPSSGTLRADWLAALAEDIAAMRRAGQSVVLISSGAIALGRAHLGLPPGALSLEDSQAAAAVGQTRLVAAWGAALGAHGLTTAQVLLTLEDTQNRRRYLNARSTLAALIGMGAIPVVNENDTVATDEIRYGDNDRLAARVALMAGAEALVLLSDIDGLHTADPRRDPAARHIPEVRAITPDIEAMAGDAGTDGAKGGMRTKILAAQIATQGGCAMAVTRGDIDHPIRHLTNGAPATWFLPTTSAKAARKQWIAGMKPVGTIVVDDGATAALRRGKSLLPAGVRRVDGTFERGDPVAIATLEGVRVGAGLASYGSSEARAIAGMHSDAIAGVLGYPGRAAVIHADDIMIWGT